MTSEQKRQFENQWPEIEQRLQRMLARRGVPLHKREDIVQETGLRLLRSWNRVDATRPLWPFTVTIALNLMRDQARKGLDSEVPSEFPDHRGPEDVEATSLARLEIHRAGLALAQMKPAQRNVLLAEIDPMIAPATQGKAATKMLRMRARRKLSLMMQQVSALGVASVGSVKRLGRWGHLMPFRGTSEGIVTSALCGVLCVVSLGSVVSLAPFSSLPGDIGSPIDRSGRIGSIGSDVIGGAGSQTPLSDRSLGWGGHGHTGSNNNNEAADAKHPGEGAVATGDDATFGQEGTYEIPVGHRTLVEGSYVVEVFAGGDETPNTTDPPSTIDCTEHMISPDEIDATCWDHRNPDQRYGAKVRHDGKTTLGSATKLES